MEGSIELALEDIAVEQTNDGHTIKLKPTGKQFLKAKLKDSYGNWKHYESLYINFHAPSEHTVNGK